ncbi:MAG: L-aspartate oxidase [Pseudomonadota bacterium]
MKTLEVDCLVIGTGLAGCVAALELAERGRAVTLITRAEKPEETATSYAQGGIVFRGAPESTPDQLIRDIQEAGAGICNEKAVRVLATDGPALVEKILLKNLEIPFDRNEDGALDTTGEAAHSTHRILHCGDQTGAAIEKAFLNELAKRKDVKILTRHTAVDLLTLAHHSTRAQDQYEPSRCIGAYVFDQAKGEIVSVLARYTVLATGGLGRLYLHTTNPVGARGDGMAMAYRTGARIMNLEYIQFHPTALYRKTQDRFLITEALRGEGARLYNAAGEEFMKKYDPRGTLAPRDIVSRAIHDELLREESSHWVYLDISHKPADWIRKRFPGVFAECLKEGIDITVSPIPVVPAAHYSCGGVFVDLDGRTTIRNLYAVGEVSCTGVHGANRLASTSLLEDLVWGVRAGRAIAGELSASVPALPPVRSWKPETEKVDADLLIQDWVTIKHTMWNYVGLIRTPKRLERAQRILRELSDEVQKFYAGSKLSDDLIGLRNGSTTAQLIVTAALRNRQSLGCHFVRSD